MENRDELKGLNREVELSLVKRFLDEHEVVQVLMLAGTEEIRDWFGNLVRRFIDEGEAELVGLLALWLVMKSPRDTLINLAVWLETEGSLGGEEGPASFADGDDEADPGGEPDSNATGTRHCPDETQLLAYFEGGLQPRARREVERHVAGCDGCRGALTLLTGIPPADFAEPVTSAETAARHQAARVMSMLGREEARRRSAAKPVGCAPILAAIGAFLIIAGGAVAIYRWHISRSHDEEGFVALRAAVSKNRRTPLRISGGLPYSPYTVTPLVGDLEFERAESNLRFARDNSAPSARLNLARVYLARARPGDSEKALWLLDGIQSSGARPAEILNETGIANFMLGQYAEAISTFTHALGAEPKMAEALFNKAYTEERVDRQAARQDWENFIAWTSDPDWTSEARERLAVFD
jgi:hypothetical protein